MSIMDATESPQVGETLESVIVSPELLSGLIEQAMEKILIPIGVRLTNIEAKLDNLETAVANGFTIKVCGEQPDPASDESGNTSMHNQCGINPSPIPLIENAQASTLQRKRTRDSTAKMSSDERSSPPRVVLPEEGRNSTVLAQEKSKTRGPYVQRSTHWIARKLRAGLTPVIPLAPPPPDPYKFTCTLCNRDSIRLSLAHAIRKTVST